MLIETRLNKTEVYKLGSEWKSNSPLIHTSLVLIIPWCKSFQAFSATNINWAYHVRTCSVLIRQFCLHLVKFPDIPQRVSPALLDGQEASWFYPYSAHPWFTAGTSPGNNFLKVELWEQRNACFCSSLYHLVMAQGWQAQGTESASWGPCLATCSPAPWPAPHPQSGTSPV